MLIVVSGNTLPGAVALPTKSFITLHTAHHKAAVVIPTGGKAAIFQTAYQRAVEVEREAKLLLSQFSNPLVLLLVVAVALSRAIEKLQQLVTTRCMVRRSGQEQLLLPEAVVPGDVVVLKAGDIIPADGRILVGALEKPAGSNAFEKGIRQFGYLVMRIAVVIALAVLVLNILYERLVADSLLFALALAVGLTPELLPAIITITLSAGTRRLAACKVIVRKLSAIQCLGEMTVLCWAAWWAL